MHRRYIKFDVNEATKCISYYYNSLFVNQETLNHLLVQFAGTPLHIIKARESLRNLVDFPYIFKNWNEAFAYFRSVHYQHPNSNLSVADFLKDAIDDYLKNNITLRDVIYTQTIQFNKVTLEEIIMTNKTNYDVAVKRTQSAADGIGAGRKEVHNGITSGIKSSSDETKTTTSHVRKLAEKLHGNEVPKKDTPQLELTGSFDGDTIHDEVDTVEIDPNQGILKQFTATIAEDSPVAFLADILSKDDMDPMEALELLQKVCDEKKVNVITEGSDDSMTRAYMIIDGEEVDLKNVELFWLQHVYQSNINKLKGKHEMEIIRKPTFGHLKDKYPGRATIIQRLSGYVKDRGKLTEHFLGQMVNAIFDLKVGSSVTQRRIVSYAKDKGYIDKPVIELLTAINSGKFDYPTVNLQKGITNKKLLKEFVADFLLTRVAIQKSTLTVREVLEEDVRTNNRYAELSLRILAIPFTEGYLDMPADDILAERQVHRTSIMDKLLADSNRTEVPVHNQQFTGSKSLDLVNKFLNEQPTKQTQSDNLEENTMSAQQREQHPKAVNYQDICKDAPTVVTIGDFVEQLFTDSQGRIPNERIVTRFAQNVIDQPTFEQWSGVVAYMLSDAYEPNIDRLPYGADIKNKMLVLLRGLESKGTFDFIDDKLSFTGNEPQVSERNPSLTQAEGKSRTEQAGDKEVIVQEFDPSTLPTEGLNPFANSATGSYDRGSQTTLGHTDGVSLEQAMDDFNNQIYQDQTVDPHTSNDKLSDVITPWFNFKGTAFPQLPPLLIIKVMNACILDGFMFQFINRQNQVLDKVIPNQRDYENSTDSYYLGLQVIARALISGTKFSQDELHAIHTYVDLFIAYTKESNIDKKLLFVVNEFNALFNDKWTAFEKAGNAIIMNLDEKLHGEQSSDSLLEPVLMDQSDVPLDVMRRDSDFINPVRLATGILQWLMLRQEEIKVNTQPQQQSQVKPNATQTSGYIQQAIPSEDALWNIEQLFRVDTPMSKDGPIVNKPHTTMALQLMSLGCGHKMIYLEGHDASYRSFIAIELYLAWVLDLENTPIDPEIKSWFDAFLTKCITSGALVYKRGYMFPTLLNFDWFDNIDYTMTGVVNKLCSKVTQLHQSHLRGTVFTTPLYPTVKAYKSKLSEEQNSATHYSFELMGLLMLIVKQTKGHTKLNLDPHAQSREEQKVKFGSLHKSVLQSMLQQAPRIVIDLQEQDYILNRACELANKLNLGSGAIALYGTLLLKTAVIQTLIGAPVQSNTFVLSKYYGLFLLPNNSWSELEFTGASEIEEAKRSTMILIEYLADAVGTSYAELAVYYNTNRICSMALTIEQLLATNNVSLRAIVDLALMDNRTNPMSQPYMGGQMYQSRQFMQNPNQGPLGYYGQPYQPQPKPMYQPQPIGAYAGYPSYQPQPAMYPQKHYSSQFEGPRAQPFQYPTAQTQGMQPGMIHGASIQQSIHPQPDNMSNMEMETDVSQMKQPFGGPRTFTWGPSAQPQPLFSKDISHDIDLDVVDALQELQDEIDKLETVKAITDEKLSELREKMSDLIRDL